MNENRRFEYRIMADLLVDNLDLKDAEVLRSKGSIRELSASGCRLESAVELKLGQEILLSFQLAGIHRVEQVRARVIRRLSPRSHKVVAVEFVDLPETEQYKIREFVVWREAQEASK
ncbi:PilZ domain-containing protein [candidate division FCPU426 bacterium]|nr:PilZ domain-containing protein [candidate division FCPU426 bacterium]